MWITLNEESKYQVEYGVESGKYIYQKEGTFHKYSSSNDYSAVVHEAILTNLPMRQRIFYK
jgi:hypothetical protein